MDEDFVLAYERTLAHFASVEPVRLDAAVRQVLHEHPHPVRLLDSQEAFLRMVARLSSPDQSLVQQARTVARGVREGVALVALSEWRNHLLMVDTRALERQLAASRETSPPTST